MRLLTTDTLDPAAMVGLPSIITRAPHTTHAGSELLHRTSTVANDEAPSSLARRRSRANKPRRFIRCARSCVLVLRCASSSRPQLRRRINARSRLAHFARLDRNRSCPDCMASFLLNLSRVGRGASEGQCGGLEHACQPGISEYRFIDEMRSCGLQVHGQGGAALLQRLLRQYRQGEQASSQQMWLRASSLCWRPLVAVRAEVSDRQ